MVGLFLRLVGVVGDEDEWMFAFLCLVGLWCLGFFGCFVWISGRYYCDSWTVNRENNK